MSDLLIERGANISPCGKYRYLLWRTWGKQQPLVFIMLNPSTADANQDDATIRVCMGRARRMKVGGIIVANVFAFRATKPSDLFAAADPVGPLNSSEILHAITIPNRMVIAAWGDHGMYRHGWLAVRQEAKDCGQPLHALRLTKAGTPCHPLRIAYAVEPFVWRTP